MPNGGDHANGHANVHVHKAWPRVEVRVCVAVPVRHTRARDRSSVTVHVSGLGGVTRRRPRAKRTETKILGPPRRRPAFRRTSVWCALRAVGPPSAGPQSQCPTTHTLPCPRTSQCPAIHFATGRGRR